MAERPPAESTPSEIEPGLGGGQVEEEPKRATETEVAHARLRRAILRGELSGGSVLKQGELAKEFGVGRTPLREAMRLLEREGLVEAEPQHRARVAGFSMDDLEQLYAMRIELEALAIRITVPRLSFEELRKLKDELARMEDFAKAEDYEGWEGPHRAFHFGLVAHAGERLFKTIAQLSDHAERYRRYYTVETPYAWSRGIAEHDAVLEAAVARDPVAAAHQLARHYASVSLGLLTALAPEREPAVLRMALRTVMGAQELDQGGTR